MEEDPHVNRAQASIDLMQRIFSLIESNVVHLDHAISNVVPEEIIRLKYDYDNFDGFVVKNLDYILRVSKSSNM